MKRGILLGDTLDLNGVVWIRSLSEDELGPSRRIIEDLEPLVSGKGCARPVLHFDCHGSAENGLLLQPSGEWLSWGDLAEALRAINVATANSLCCVFAACFGLHVFLEVELSKSTPFYVTIAPEKGVAVGLLLERTVAFYRELFAGQDIGAAQRRELAPHMQMLHCKGILMEGLARYVSTHCMGRAVAPRRERMVTALLRRRGIVAPTKSQLGAARARVKTFLEPSQLLIDHFAPRFLIGRDPGFGIAELKRLAQIDARRNRLLIEHK